MTNEVSIFALKSTLNEVKNVCPEISHSFIFGEDAQILAKDDDTDQTNAVQAADILNALVERADAVGGIESITFQTEKSRIHFACTNNLYTTTISSKESDEKFVKTLPQVLIPTVLRLVEVISKESLKDNFVEEKQPEPVEVAEVEEEAEEETPKEEIVAIEEETETKPFYPEPTATQFMIENIGGLLVPSDIVQIDNAVVIQWKDTYEDKKMTEVEIETLSGQTTRCKFKPIKGAEHNGKGVIRMPKKVQLALQASKGELIMVKPVVE